MPASNTHLLAQLENQAIQAAKTQNWLDAITLNQQMIAEDPELVPAHMRLGVALAQLDRTAEATSAFEHVLELDSSNQLAKKHLQKLKNHQSIVLSSLPAHEQFIEEPGKTKTVELHRIAGREQLEHLSVGQVCELKPKNRFISIEVNGAYIGSLPEDLSSRLTRLIKGGNTYVCYVRSVSPTTCGASVFVKELTRSKEQEFIHSFPVHKGQMSAVNEMYADDQYAFEIENIPLQLVETDNDDEPTRPDTFPIEDHDHDRHEEMREEQERPQNNDDDTD